MKYIYVCAIKMLGFPFAVTTEEEAERWVQADPAMHYYDKMSVDRIDEDGNRKTTPAP